MTRTSIPLYLEAYVIIYVSHIFCLFLNRKIFRSLIARSYFKVSIPVLTSMEFKIPRAVDIQKMQGQQQSTGKNTGRLEK